MIPYEIIRKKRDGLTLTEEEIGYLVRGYTSGEIPDYQMSAFLMAVFFRGMESDEITCLTEVMMNTGIKLDFQRFDKPVMDKHSTGGVGDKVSIPLAPIVASFDIVVPMISGRGLGHTGGTLDKLESIPGFRTSLTVDEMYTMVEKIGFFMGGQTEEMCPADRKMYALRDATATVESIPLIASSIMSKKLSEGIHGLVLDVKTGTGAFMRDREKAEELARTMIEIGKGMGRDVVAYITNMDRPLGRACGNSLEIIESIEFLKGEYPEDLKEVVYTLSGEILMMAGLAEDMDEAFKMIDRKIESGEALERFEKLVELQGGDPKVVESYDRLPVAKNITELKAWDDGYIEYMDTYEIGMSIVELGGGRRRKEDSIDHGVGLVFLKKLGDKVEKGETICRVYHNGDVDGTMERLKRSIVIGDKKEVTIIYDRLT